MARVWSPDDVPAGTSSTCSRADTQLAILESYPWGSSSPETFVRPASVADRRLLARAAGVRHLRARHGLLHVG